MTEGLGAQEEGRELWACKAWEDAAVCHPGELSGVYSFVLWLKLRGSANRIAKYKTKGMEKTVKFPSMWNATFGCVLSSLINGYIHF